MYWNCHVHVDWSGCSQVRQWLYVTWEAWSAHRQAVCSTESNQVNYNNNMLHHIHITYDSWICFGSSNNMFGIISGYECCSGRWFSTWRQLSTNSTSIVTAASSKLLLILLLLLLLSIWWWWWRHHNFLCLRTKLHEIAKLLNKEQIRQQALLLLIYYVSLCM